MAKNRWKKPELHDHSDENHEHKATWLELFYDLIFVVALGELIHVLVKDFTITGLLKFIFLFMPVWWVWLSTTFYNDRFESHDLSQRIFTFLNILGLVLMTYFIHDALGETSDGFIISYLAVRTLIMSMWARAGIHNPPAQTFVGRYLIGFMLAAIFYVISLYFDGSTRFILWGCGFFIEYIFPVTTFKIQEALPEHSRTSHLPERFGLFMIIVLGESIVAVVQGMSGAHHMSTSAIISMLFGAIITFNLWWLYFDHVNARTIKTGMWNLAGWAYGHFPLIISVASLGASILVLITRNGDRLGSEAVWLISGSMSLALISIGLLEFTLSKKEETPCKTKFGQLVRFGGAALCLLVPFLCLEMHAWNMLFILTIILVLQVIQGELSEGHHHGEHDAIE